MNQLKVLIVEDESLIALQLEMKLKRLGYEVCQMVTNGVDAIAAARTKRPDLILMDIRLMGEMDGIEAARQIKSFAAIPVIFTTGYPDASLKERAMSLSPMAFLIKPIEISQIDKVIQNNLKWN